MTVAISGQVPAKAQNGMYDLEEAWTGERTPEEVIAVVKIRRASNKFDDEKQQHLATMKFVHIEPLNGDLEDAGRKLLKQAVAKRPDAEMDTELDMPKEDGK